MTTSVTLPLLNWKTDGSITVWHGSDIAKPSPKSGNLVPTQGINFPLEGSLFPVVGIEMPETPTGKEFQSLPDYYSDNIRSTTDKHVAAVDLKKIDRSQDSENDQTETYEVFVQLRRLHIKLNPTVRKIVRSHSANVQNAIAHIQERITAGENFHCLETAFVTACTEGAIPERLQQPPVVLPQPTQQQFEALQTAKMAGTIRHYYSSPYQGGNTVLIDDWHNRRVIAWWKFLDLTDPALS